uniref:Proline dehydrogenase n=1 Tax=Globodera rostochiensis TaxID=31243 RepID=A0A914HDN8_GLORO
MFEQKKRAPIRSRPTRSLFQSNHLSDLSLGDILSNSLASAFESFYSCTLSNGIKMLALQQANSDTCRLFLIGQVYHRMANLLCRWSYSLRSPSIAPQYTSHYHQRRQQQQSFASVSKQSLSSSSAGEASQPPPSALLKKSPEQLRAESELCYQRLDLTFQNAKEAFKSKTNFELLRAQLVFACCQVNWMVQHNQKMMRVARVLLGKRLFNALMRSTFYGHFVAGENIDEVSETVAELQRFGVKSILDYSVEADISEEEAKEKAVEGIDEDKTEQIPPALDVLASSVLPHHEAQLEDTLGDQSVADLVDQTQKQFSVHKEFGDRREHVVSARTYFYSGESECDRNAEIFCNCIDATAHATMGQGFTAIKLTALGRPRLLMRLTQAIAQMENLFRVLTGSSWENLCLSRICEDELIDRLQEFGIKSDQKAIREWFKHADFNEDGFVDFFDWGRLLDVEAGKLQKVFQVLNINTGKLEPVLNNLTERESLELSNMMGRLTKIADHAVSRGVRLMVDAEQTYFQLAISRLTVALMRRYNHERGFVLNTYQAYLNNTLASLTIDMQLARQENFHFGCKLVRGAYMDQERLRAAAIGYEDPIQPSHQATSDNYHQCLDAIVGEWAQRGRNTVSVMAATHNVDSVRYAVELMRQRGIAPSERVICFGQLYGMCDWVGFIT